MLGTEDLAEQAQKIDTLLKAASQPDIILTIHYKPSTRQIFFGATAVVLSYDQLVQLLSEGIKAASIMKAEDEQKESQKQKTGIAPSS